MLFFLCIALAGALPLDVKALLKEREEALAEFHDARTSPLAVISRHVFDGEQPLRIGSDRTNQVMLEGLAPQALEIRARGGSFEVTRDGRTDRAETKAMIEMGRYGLWLVGRLQPTLLVFDSEAPGLRKGPWPVWFAPDPAARVEARLVPASSPREQTVLTTRGAKRQMLRLGKLEFSLHGRKHSLVAVRSLEPAGNSTTSIFFRDATTGKESYAVGRYIDAEALGEDRYALDFNRAYNPTCAFSPFYDCPIPPKENVLSVPVRAGERDPGGH
jgi:uncharacterized protein (DUF1684 family)